MRHIIVGIDSGKRAAIACIDLSGNVVGLDTGISVGMDWYLDRIRSAGSPVVIASDKKRAGTLIGKLAAIFHCIVFTPQSDMSVDRKREFTEGINVGSLHERDALSAALNAYNSYSNKLNQAERYARERNYDEIDRVKALVIKRYSIHEVLEGRDNVGRF
ncbi:MAG: DUF460 domain-containing protein [Candidatus Micrarchaeota archaeon]|nr:DUF460 domain-containing protein [Candidatus Micrarchaeota archaeon]